MEKIDKQPKKLGFKDQFAQEQQKQNRILAEFDIDNYTSEADVTYSEEIRGVGIVKYQVLNYDENKKLNEDLTAKGITKADDRGLYIVAEMMHRADGKTTPEKLS